MLLIFLRQHFTVKIGDFAFYNITALDFIVDLYTLSTDFINPAELSFWLIIYKGHLYEAKSSAEGQKNLDVRDVNIWFLGEREIGLFRCIMLPSPKKIKFCFLFSNLDWEQSQGFDKELSWVEQQKMYIFLS